ncbi:MAG: GAF domain-containing protein [Dissulfurispiraceae bacterium]
MTFLTCLVLLAGFFLGKQFEVEYREIQPHVYYAQVPVGHMSPITATNFLVAALGVLFLVFSDKGKQRFKHVAAFMAMAVVITGFVIILGYLHGTPLLYGGTIIPVALTTAISFMLTGVGLITAAGPHVLPVRVFAGPTVSNRLMRTFLPAITTFVLIDGLAYEATFSSAANPALIAALIAFLSMIVVAAIVSKIAKSIGGEIDRAHIERNQAEENLRLDEERLQTLLKLSLMVVKSEKELTDFALEESVRLTKSKGGYLHFFNEDEQTIQLYSWSKDVLKICTVAEAHHYPLDAAGVWADSIRLRRPVIHNDYQNLPDKKGYPEGHFHLFRHLGIPIFDGEHIVGVTGVGNKETPYDESDVRQITLFMHKLWGILKQRLSEAERMRLILELQEALDKVKTLSGMLPICASCKKIRDDQGYWNQIESYISEHSGAQFTHAICPDCVKKLYPDIDLSKKNK